MPTILSISQDESLAASRSAVLRLTGAEVQTSTAADAPPLLKARRFDLVVLCHTIALEQATEIAALAHRRHRRTPVLQLIGDGRDLSPPGLADDIAPAEPASLIAKAVSLLIH